MPVCGKLAWNNLKNFSTFCPKNGTFLVEKMSAKKKLLCKAHHILWEVRHYYTPSSNTFLTNGAEEVIQSLIHYHDKIKLFLSRNHPGILQDTGKHQPSFSSRSKPRTTQPYARRKRYNFQRQRFCQADQEHFKLSGPQVWQFFVTFWDLFSGQAKLKKSCRIYFLALIFSTKKSSIFGAKSWEIL